MKNRKLPLARPARLAGAALFLALATAVVSTPAQAQRLVLSDIVQAEILPGWQAADGSRMAALHLTLADGWHTYWRIPGEAGIAPRFDWSRSQNIRSIEPLWPAPEVYDQNGLRSIVYQDELILPLRIQPQNSGRPMALMGEIQIGVCSDTCVPADLQVTAALRGVGAFDPRITDSLSQGAQPASGAGLQRTTCRLVPGDGGADLTLRATLPRVGAEEVIIMELPGSGYWVSNSRTWREGGDLVAQARVRDPDRGSVGINRSTLAFSILSEGRLVQSTGCVGG